MARARAEIRIAVVCTAASALWLTAGPAQAGDGDLVDGAVGGAVHRTVGDGVEGTVGRVTSDPVLKDTARTLKRLSHPAAELLRDGPRMGDPEPQDDSATSADDTSANDPPQRQKADRSPPVRERVSAVRWSPRTPAHIDSANRPKVAERGARQESAATAPQVDHPCASGSLAARDLRRCARADISLPGLGGVPRNLLSTGLVMVGAGLVLVARGRRRGACVGPAI